MDCLSPKREADYVTASVNLQHVRELAFPARNEMLTEIPRQDVREQAFSA
jgi:hypothetical protein